MSDVNSKTWLQELATWGKDTAQKLLEGVLFGKKAAAGGTADSGVGETGREKATKWLPFALIGGALLAILFLYKGKE